MLRENKVRNAKYVEKNKRHVQISVAILSKFNKKHLYVIENKFFHIIICKFRMLNLSLSLSSICLVSIFINCL